MRTDGGEDVLGGHVELHESLNRGSSLGIAGGDGLRTKEAGFLSGIEVNLDWGCGLEAGGNQHSEDLNCIYSAGTILTRKKSAHGFGMNQETARTSSAPGARPLVGSLKLIESWWAPRIVTGPEVEPAILAITENWVQEWLNLVIMTPDFPPAIVLSLLKIHSADC